MLTPWKSLSIVLPCYNEEANLETTVEGLDAYLARTVDEYEIIAVNDGSTDNTADVMAALEKEYPQFRGVHHGVNGGYGKALITGIDAATKDVVGFMDADGQFLPEDFDSLLPLLDSADIATGIRTSRADPLPRKLNALAYRTLLWGLFRVSLPDINCAMKLFRRKIWPELRPETATGGIFNGELFARAKKNNRKIAWAPVRHLPRTQGEQTGAKLSVVATAFKELFELRFRL